MRFRVTIAPHPPTEVEASHWMAALAEGVERYAPDVAFSELSSRVQEDGTVVVLDAASGGRFEVRPLPDEASDEYVVRGYVDEETCEGVRPASARDEAEEIQRAPSSERAYRRTLEAMVALVACEAAWIVVVEPDRRLRFAACSPTPRGKLTGTVLPAGTGLAEDVIARQASMALRDVAKDARVWRDMESRTGIRPRSVLLVPCAGRACLTFINAPDREGFGASHVADAEFLAAALARRLTTA